jgi:hypothetical protein
MQTFSEPRQRRKARMCMNTIHSNINYSQLQEDNTKPNKQKHKPNQTKPNQTKPNQTKPNQSNEEKAQKKKKKPNKHNANFIEAEPLGQKDSICAIALGWRTQKFKYCSGAPGVAERCANA